MGSRFASRAWISPLKVLGIIEHIDGVLEIDAMLGEIACGLGWIPFEVHMRSYRLEFGFPRTIGSKPAARG